MTEELSLEEFRQHWTDALAAFGAHIEVEVLPDGVESRTRGAWLDSEAEELDRPTRVRVVNHKCVTGPVLVEIDEQRMRIAAAFRSEAGGG